MINNERVDVYHYQQLELGSENSPLETKTITITINPSNFLRCKLEEEHLETNGGRVVGKREREAT